VEVVNFEFSKLSPEYWDAIEVKNESSNEVYIGSEAFDKHLISNGWEVKGVRSLSHPFGGFYKRDTNDYLTTGIGLSGANLYIVIRGDFYRFPRTKEEIAMFDDGKLIKFF
jgi:hypothetical protein